MRHFLTVSDVMTSDVVRVTGHVGIELRRIDAGIPGSLNHLLLGNPVTVDVHQCVMDARFWTSGRQTGSWARRTA